MLWRFYSRGVGRPTRLIKMALISARLALRASKRLGRRRTSEDGAKRYVPHTLPQMSGSPARIRRSIRSEYAKLTSMAVPSRMIRLTFFHSAATCPHEPEARRTASRRPSRGSGGPTNGTWSAAVKSYAAGHCMCSLNRCDGDLRCKMR